MSTNISQRFRLHNRDAVQSYLLLGFGVVCLLGALLLRLNYRVYPVGLFLFGLGLLIAAAVNPSNLMVAGLFFTLVGAAFFLALKQLLPFDNALLIIAISLALIGIALVARRGYVKAGALTPGIFTLLVGLIQYPPLGIAPKIGSFILSLWFPGVALLVLGLVYWFLSMRRA
jgi:hypothetical protein